MTLRSRTVTGTARYPDLMPWPDALVTAYLRDGSITEEGTFPPTGRSTTTDENGSWELSLWCNEDGLIRSSYLYVSPGNRTFEFTLPYEDGTPITIEELEARGIIDEWSTPESDTLLSAFIANLASLVNPALGANLVGWLAAGAGALGQTVRDKLRTMLATTDHSSFSASVTAAAGRTLTVNSAITLASNLTVPDTVSLRFEQNGVISVNTGVTLTIDGPLGAGRQQIFAGDGTVTGDPKIEASFPEWFGAVADGETDDTIAVEKAAAFYPRVTGTETARYLLHSARVRHTTLDLYSRGKVQDYATWTPQFPNGMWYGARLPSGAILEGMHFVLTTGSTVGKLHSAFACGDPTSATRVTAPAIRRCTFEVADDAPVLPYRTTLREPVAINQTDWVLDAVDEVVIGDPIRLTMDDLTDDTIWIPNVVDVDPNTNTVTVDEGPPYEASQGNLVRGPYIAPISVLLAQSADGLRFEDNRLEETLDTGTADKLIGIYGFDCYDATIRGNYIEGVEKLAGLDYCERITVSENEGWNSAQLVDFNKACFDVQVNNNIMDRSETDVTGDAYVEYNGTVGAMAKGNRFSHGTRGFIINTKGLVYNTWADCMAQNTDATEEGMDARKVVAYHSVWKKIRLHGNHHEWMNRHAIYVGDNWKSYTEQRVENPTCGTDIDIDDVAINCGNFAYYGRWNGVVQVQEGKQVRIRIHIDNPDAIRGWTAASVATGQREIQLASVDGVSVGQPLRLVQVSDDNASVYTIEAIDTNTKIVTVSRDILVAGAVSQPATAAASGTPVWIGPGNCCGVSVRSWIDADHWTVDGVPTYAVGADAISDCEVLDLQGSVKNCASYGLFAYQARLVQFNHFKIENCGSRDRIRFAALGLAMDARACRIRGSVEIDNSQEFAQNGSSLFVDQGLAVRGTNLADATKWSTTKPFLDLLHARLVGHLLKDLYINDEVFTVAFNYAFARSSIIPLSDQVGAPSLPWPLRTVPRYLSGTTLSPLFIAQTGGQFVAWQSAHATQDHAYMNFMTPAGCAGLRTLKAKIVGTSTSENIIIKAWWKTYANGDAIAWDTSNSTQQASIAVVDTIVEVTIAQFTMVAGEMNSVRFRPRTVADGNVTQDKQIIEVWLE